jgi:hypothetical protein
VVKKYWNPERATLLALCAASNCDSKYGPVEFNPDEMRSLFNDDAALDCVLREIEELPNWRNPDATLNVKWGDDDERDLPPLPPEESVDGNPILFSDWTTYPGWEIYRNVDYVLVRAKGEGRCAGPVVIWYTTPN